jgi:hypothetical protein
MIRKGQGKSMMSKKSKSRLKKPTGWLSESQPERKAEKLDFFGRKYRVNRKNLIIS